MENRVIHKNSSILELVHEYPEIAEIMAEIGFHDVLKTGMLQTVGRFMTLEKGCKMKDIDWNTVVDTFSDYGFKLE